MKYIPLALFVLFTTLCQISSAQESASTETTGLQITDRTDEERIQFLIDIAGVYFEEEDYVSAVNAYERILEIDPKHVQARYILAHTYINAKQYPKAEEALIALIEDSPDDFKLKNNLAWLYATAEDLKFRDGEKAVKIAQEAMVMAPYDHHVWSTLSEAYYVSGDYEKAHRAITHMALLAERYSQGLDEKQIANYNEQIRKCKRAWDTQKMLEGIEEEDSQ